MNYYGTKDNKMKTILFILITFMGISMIGCDSKKMAAEDTPDQMLLKNWQPKSVYKVPVTDIQKAKFPVIDMHAHNYAMTPEEVAKRVAIMDEAGIEKSVVFTNATGAKFDSVYSLYSKYPDRFMVYCGFDFSKFPEKGWSEKAITELRRCVKEGAKGIGELHDKGSGMIKGIHPDDPQLDPLFDACKEMRLPINIHIAEPIWMYEAMDSTNDGLTRSWTWRVKDKSKITDHSGMMKIISNMLERHPDNHFVLAHLANCSYDFSILGKLFDDHPNFHADVSARFAEFSTIPRTTSQFFEKYQDRIVYGTDYGWETWDTTGDYGNHTSTLQMFRMTFRVLETLDEHFYLTDLVGYKWPMYGLGLSESALKKIYRDNALKIISK